MGTAIEIGDAEGVAICEQRRFVGIPFAQLQREIEKMAFMYFGSKTVIEMSGIGAAVFGNLELPQHRKLEFWTTERSKAKIIGDVQLALENHQLVFDHEANPQLVKDLRGYKNPDTFVVQDSVMSLAVTLGKARCGGSPWTCARGDTGGCVRPLAERSRPVSAERRVDAF